MTFEVMLSIQSAALITVYCVVAGGALPALLAARGVRVRGGVPAGGGGARPLLHPAPRPARGHLGHGATLGDILISDTCVLIFMTNLELC